MGRKARSVPAMSLRSPRDTTPGPWATSPASRWTLEVSPSTHSGASALAYCPCRPNSMTYQKTDAPPAEREDFIREIVKADLASGAVREVVTRFPPEPNGYLHIGHAKSICLNFGIARQFGGVCNLRMDDTNPAKEDVEYEDSIVADVRWLVAGWADHCLGLKPKGATARASGSDFHLPAAAIDGGAEVEPFRASDYFDALHTFAVRLIERGRAFVCDHTAEEVDRMRGAPGERGE